MLKEFSETIAYANGISGTVYRKKDVQANLESTAEPPPLKKGEKVLVQPTHKDDPTFLTVSWSVCLSAPSMVDECVGHRAVCLTVSYLSVVACHLPSRLPVCPSSHLPFG